VNSPLFNSLQSYFVSLHEIHEDSHSMHKFLFIVLFLFFISGVSSGQSKKIYFDKRAKETSKENGYVYKFIHERDNDTTEMNTYYFVKNDRIQAQSPKSGSSRKNSVQFYENGQTKWIERFEKSNDIYRLTYYYPNGKPQEVSIRSSQFDSKINRGIIVLSYWDSAGVELVSDKNGFCKCYSFNFDSSTVYRDQGNYVDGVSDGAWSNFRNDTLQFSERYNHGVFQSGIRYDNGKEIEYHQIEIQPQFPGGISQMMSFVSKNLNYPREARKKGIYGKVFVQFVVGKDGSVQDVIIIKGVDPVLDEEATRVVMSMPKWSPGIQRGKPVKARYVLPINFHL